MQQKEAITRICEENCFVYLAAFGTRTTDGGRTETDLDLLAEFAPGQTPGFLGIARLEEALSEVLVLKVNLRTPRELSRHARDQVIKSSEDICAG